MTLSIFSTGDFVYSMLGMFKAFERSYITLKDKELKYCW